MKKRTIRFIGVCAITLVTLSIGNTEVVKAQEGTQEIQEVQSRASNVTTTADNLKAQAKISVARFNNFANWLSANTVNTTIVSNVDFDKNIALERIDSPVETFGFDGENFFEDLFYDETQGVVAQNVGLSFSNPEGLEIDALLNSIFGGYAREARPTNGIWMTSDMGINGNIYGIGDKINVKFWTNYGIGNSNQLRLIKDVSVILEDVGAEAIYQVSVSELDAEVGQVYTPAQDILVTHKEEEYALKPVVIEEKNNQIYYIAKNGSLQSLYTGSMTSFMSALQETQIGTDGPIYSKIYEEFGYEIDEFYFLMDESHFEAGDRVVEDEEIVNGVVQSIVRKYNQPVSNFNQELMILVPYYDNDSTNRPSLEDLYISRLIRVSEASSVIPEVEAVSVYRVYNPNNGEHLFTTSQSEYNGLVGKGWTGENVAWNAPKEGTPVYRLYNPNSGEHFYTDNVAEYNNVASQGWTKEGVAFYSADAEDGLPVYRSFNPNAKDAGSHMFTLSLAEYNNLTAAGWSPEGVAFYALNTAQ